MRLDILRVGFSILPVLFRRLFKLLGVDSDLPSVNSSNALRRERVFLVGDVLPPSGVLGLTVSLLDLDFSVVDSSLAAAIRRFRVEAAGGDVPVSLSLSFCSDDSDFASDFSGVGDDDAGAGAAVAVVAVVGVFVVVAVAIAVASLISSSVFVSFTASSSSSNFSVLICSVVSSALPCCNCLFRMLRVFRVAGVVGVVGTLSVPDGVGDSVFWRLLRVAIVLV